MSRPNSIPDPIGKVFGRLTIIGSGERSGKVGFICRCECGNLTKPIQSSHLRNGDTKSCGCWSLDYPSHFKHGYNNTPEHIAWRGMWARCTRESNPAYAGYKDRAPPEEWRDFLVFLKEVGLRPSDKYSLDRIKNHLPYGPGNCKWSTRKEQAQNTKQNLLVVFKGETLCFAEACRKANLKYSTAHNRWHRTKDMKYASDGLLTLAIKC